MLRIIAELDAKSGHWSAWFSSQPEQAFGGHVTSLAVERLLQSCGYKFRDVTIDQSASREGHFEFLLGGRNAAAAVCPDCGGSGKYTGLTSVEDCGVCGGSGHT